MTLGMDKTRRKAGSIRSKSPVWSCFGESPPLFLRGDLSLSFLSSGQLFDLAMLMLQGAVLGALGLVVAGNRTATWLDKRDALIGSVYGNGNGMLW